MGKAQGDIDELASNVGVTGYLTLARLGVIFQNVLNESINPVTTGLNVSKTTLFTYNGVGVDSITPNDINVYNTVKTELGALQPPHPKYNPFSLVLSNAELEFVNPLSNDLTIEVEISGVFVSSSSINDAQVSVRLNSSQGLGTGSTRYSPAGTLTGVNTVRVSFTTKGYFTLTSGGFVKLEVSKNFAGDLKLVECILIVKPIY